MTRVACQSCGLSRDLPEAIARGLPGGLRCPRCGTPVPERAEAPPDAPPGGSVGDPGRWRPVAGWQAAALALGALLLWSSMRTHGLLFAVVSGADLVFHEAGHPVFGLLGWRLLTYLGGALGQLFFPVVSAAAFARRGQAASFAAALLWAGFNLVDVGRYAADGRIRALPLLAADVGEHDWWNILGMLGLRQRAEPIGGAIQALGWAVMLGATAWLARRWWSSRAGTG